MTPVIVATLKIPILFGAGCMRLCNAYRSVLLGIASNHALKDVTLNLSGNGLGTAGSHVLEVCLPTVANVSTLDLSDNGAAGWRSFI